MTWGDDFAKNAEKHFKEQTLPPLTSKATRILKSYAPDYRDVRATTGVGVSKNPKYSVPGKTMTVWFFSDPKKPDVFDTAGKRKIGRPEGSRNGNRSSRQKYANGVDLANISNGNRGGGTRRKTPMPTAGWFDRGVKAASQVFK